MECRAEYLPGTWWVVTDNLPETWWVVKGRITFLLSELNLEENPIKIKLNLDLLPSIPIS